MVTPGEIEVIRTGSVGDNSYLLVAGDEAALGATTLSAMATQLADLGRDARPDDTWADGIPAGGHPGPAAHL